MRAKVSGLFLLLIAQQGCAHAAPAPKPITHATVVEEEPGPRYASIPHTFRDDDFICVNVNEPGTCATVAEVKQFLRSRRAE